MPVKFKWQSSLTHHGNAVQRKKIIRGGFAATASAIGYLTMIVDTENGSLSYTKKLSSGFQSNGYTADGSGKYLGMTITGTLAGFTGSNLALEYQEGPLWG